MNSPDSTSDRLGTDEDWRVAERKRQEQEQEAAKPEPPGVAWEVATAVLDTTVYCLAEGSKWAAKKWTGSKKKSSGVHVVIGEEDVEKYESAQERLALAEAALETKKEQHLRTANELQRASAKYKEALEAYQAHLTSHIERLQRCHDEARDQIEEIDALELNALNELPVKGRRAEVLATKSYTMALSEVANSLCGKVNGAVNRFFCDDSASDDVGPSSPVGTVAGEPMDFAVILSEDHVERTLRTRYDAMQLLQRTEEEHDRQLKIAEQELRDAQAEMEKQQRLKVLQEKIVNLRNRHESVKDGLEPREPAEKPANGRLVSDDVEAGE